MIDTTVKEALAEQLAAMVQLPGDEARARVDDVCERWQDSPYVAEVTAAYAVVARPVFDAIAAANATGDPTSAEAVAAVTAAVDAALPQPRQAMTVALNPGVLSDPRVSEAERETVRAWMREHGLDPGAAHRIDVREDASGAWAEVSREPEHE